MSGWKDKHYRRSFIDVQDKGQSRAFYVKFAGEGVADNGGRTVLCFKVHVLVN